MSTVFLKPITGATVQLQGSMAPMPAEGMEVELDTFWRRRLADGSVVVVPKTESGVPTVSKAAMESAITKGRGR